MSLVRKVSWQGMSAARRHDLLVDEVTVVTSFKEVSGKLGSASMKRSVGRADKSSTECKTERNGFFLYVKDDKMNRVDVDVCL